MAKEIQVVSPAIAIAILMIWRKKNRDTDRYYLFAGMGGRAARRKHNIFLALALAAGAVVSSILAAIFYILNVYLH